MGVQYGRRDDRVDEQEDVYDVATEKSANTRDAHTQAIRRLGNGSAMHNHLANAHSNRSSPSTYSSTK